MHKAIMIALSTPISGSEDDAFNDWYDAVHLPEVARFPGVLSARRYKAANVAPLPGMTGASHPYLAIYELAAETEKELQGFMDRMAAAVAEGEFAMTPTIDMNRAGAILALPIGEELFSKI
jgi:hypothetical protein